MNKDDYYEAALIGITLFCDNFKNCGNYLDSEEHLRPDQPHYPHGEYDVALGDEAIRLGWFVERSGGDFRVLCPGCAKSN